MHYNLSLVVTRVLPLGVPVACVFTWVSNGGDQLEHCSRHRLVPGADRPRLIFEPRM